MAKERTHRISVSLTCEQHKLLQELSGLGLHGKNVSEVAKHLIIRELERLMSEGFIPVQGRSGQDTGMGGDNV